MYVQIDYTYSILVLLRKCRASHRGALGKVLTHDDDPDHPGLTAAAAGPRRRPARPRTHRAPANQDAGPRGVAVQRAGHDLHEGVPGARGRALHEAQGPRLRDHPQGDDRLRRARLPRVRQPGLAQLRRPDLPRVLHRLGGRRAGRVRPAHRRRLRGLREGQGGHPLHPRLLARAHARGRGQRPHHEGDPRRAGPGPHPPRWHLQLRRRPHHPQPREAVHPRLSRPDQRDEAPPRARRAHGPPAALLRVQHHLPGGRPGLHQAVQPRPAGHGRADRRRRAARSSSAWPRCP